MRNLLPLLLLAALAVPASAQNTDAEESTTLNFEVEPYCIVNVEPDNQSTEVDVALDGATVSQQASIQYETNAGGESTCEISLAASHSVDGANEGFDQVSLLVNFGGPTNLLAGGNYSDNGMDAEDVVFEEGNSDDELVIFDIAQIVASRPVTYETEFTRLALAGDHTIDLVYTASIQ